MHLSTLLLLLAATAGTTLANSGSSSRGWIVNRSMVICERASRNHNFRETCKLEMERTRSFECRKCLKSCLNSKLDYESAVRCDKCFWEGCGPD